MVRGKCRIPVRGIDGETRRLADRHGHHARGVPGLPIHAGSVPRSTGNLLHGLHFAPGWAAWKHRTG